VLDLQYVLGARACLQLLIAVLSTLFSVPSSHNLDLNTLLFLAIEIQVKISSGWPIGHNSDCSNTNNKKWLLCSRKHSPVPVLKSIVLGYD
jgi:hypothetical protein